MKKGILSGLLALTTVFSAFGAGCQKKDIHALIWTDYVETVEAYVADIYYCEFPTVRDTLGNTYEVFAEVENEQGEEVDSLGGFFLVEKEEEYKITYSVDDGTSTHSKVTTLVGIEKAKYGLTDASNVIFSVGETIDLKGMVSASKQGEMTYSVMKGDEVVSVNENTFTPSQAGVYTVQANMVKQPSYSFELYVVEQSARAYADAMILDGVSAQDIQVGTSYGDYSATISFDETKKYDSASNGSYKIKATTTGVLAEAHRTLGFRIKPSYNNAYYQALENKGYEYIAIRYMIEEYSQSGTSRFGYADATTTNTCEMAIYYDGKKVVNKSSEDEKATLPNSYTFWGNTELKKVPVGEWAEMILDISMFNASYSDGEIKLFDLVVNKGSSWDMTMYIDNVYAVKGEAATEELQTVDKGAQLDLSNQTVEKVFLDGKQTAFEGNSLTIAEYGLYEIASVDRTYYGVAKKPVMAKGTVVSFETDSFNAQHKTNAGTYTAFLKTENNGKISIDSNQASTTTSVFATTYSINPLGDKAYYESLKAMGKNYITYTYALSYEGELISPYTAGDSATKIQRNALTTGAYQHYNTVGLPSSEKTVIAYTYHYTDASGTTKNTADKGSDKYFVEMIGADCKDGTAWKEYTISIAIDDFISIYDKDKMNILSLGFTFKTKDAVSYTVTFGKIQATTQACVFDA